MATSKKSFGLRVSPEVLYKLHYVADYHARTSNKHVEYLIKQTVANFEKKHGKIKLEKN